MVDFRRHSAGGPTLRASSRVGLLGRRNSVRRRIRVRATVCAAGIFETAARPIDGVSKPMRANKRIDTANGPGLVTASPEECHDVDVRSKKKSLHTAAPTGTPRTAEAECVAVAASIGKKADRNKLRARGMTVALTASTAAIPVLIGLSGDDHWWGKVAPSGLAALSALLVALNGLERPHERWVLYRRYQRLVQAEAKKYRFEAPPYDGDKRDRRLAAKVAQLELDLQTEWEGLIPSRSELASIGSGAGNPG